jgi:3-dehydroquinate dehydratase-2
MAADSSKQTVWVIHGPNLNTLGQREPEVYGHTTLSDIDAGLKERGEQLGLKVETFQSNHEGEIVEKIQGIANSAGGVIINPAAYTHTSVAIRDALLLLDTPIVEIHLSNIYKREPFRHTSMVADIATGQISGFGVDGYTMALEAVARMIG